jgi:DNA-binding FadR family transcriptional regulator
MEVANGTQPTGILTIAGLERLQAPEGQELLQEAARFNDPLLAVTVLRRRFPQDLVAMAVEMTDLRRRAAAKFVNADRMYFIHISFSIGDNKSYSVIRSANCLYSKDILSLQFY